MKTAKISFYSALLMLSLAACSAKKILPDKMPANQIIFGSGGGFTGIETQYCLLENGKIVQQLKGDTAFTIIASIDRDKAEQAFKNCTFLGLNNVKFSEPGNIYKFLTLKNANQAENRIVWGDNNSQPPSEVVTFYEALMSYLPKNPKGK